MERSQKPSNRPKTMQILNPGVPKPLQRPRTVKKRSLEKISPSPSPYSSFSEFHPVKKIDQQQKQKLELLTNNPLKFSSQIEQFAKRSQEFKAMINERQQKMEELQAFLQKSEDKMKPIIEQKPDIETLAENSHRIQQALALREKKAKEISRFVQYLQTHTDNEGNPIVEFPQNFDQIVQTSIQSQKIPGAQSINWVAFYEQKQQDQGYNQRMKTIWELDRHIQQREEQIKAFRKQLSEKSSFFVTGVKSNRTRTASSRTTISVPKADKIQKNIEVAGRYKGNYSLLDKLSNDDRKRLDFLTEQTNSEAVDQYMQLIPSDLQKELSSIDNQLKGIIPAIQWETKSISVVQSDLSSIPDMQTATPGDPTLQEVRETRLLNDRMKQINKDLLKLNQEPPKALTEAEIESLVLQTALTLQQSSVEVNKALLNDQSSLINDAHDIIEKLEKVETLDVDQLYSLLDTAQSAVTNYQKLVEIREEEIKSNSEFAKHRQKLAQTFRLFEDQEIEIQWVLSRVDLVEAQVNQAAAAMQHSEELEREVFEFEPPEIYEPTHEEIDQEIEEKAMESMEIPKQPFDDLADITPENYPMVYHIYEQEILNQE